MLEEDYHKNVVIEKARDFISVKCLIYRKYLHTKRRLTLELFRGFSRSTHVEINEHIQSFQSFFVCWCEKGFHMIIQQSFSLGNEF